MIRRFWLTVWSLAIFVALWSLYVFFHVHIHIRNETEHEGSNVNDRQSTLALGIHSDNFVLEEIQLLQTLNDTLSSVNKDLIQLLKVNAQQLSIPSKHIHSTKPIIAASLSPEKLVLQKPSKLRIKAKRAVLFTMDSISSYEQNSLSGGAAGEIIIRKSLEFAFKHFKVELKLVRSDEEFEGANMSIYDIIILDPWTWAAKGWVPKNNIRGLDEKIFILDFFGSQKLRGSGLKIPADRFLTAFGSVWNSFLGYRIDPAIANMESSASPPERLQRGVIWGKDVKHFEQRIDLLRFAADIVPLISTASRVFSHQNIEWLGHQSSASWRQLLRSSKFLLGLGDPLLGPSAIDAVTAGCMFLNPRYQREVKGVSFDSQHPYAVQKIGEPYICSFDIHSQEQLRVCIDKALATTLTPLIPADFTEENYLKRVEAIFNL